MRKLFIAMMMIGVTMGQTNSFTLTSVGEYDVDKKLGATVAGVIFTLRGESCARYTFEGGELPDAVTLSAITIRERAAIPSNNRDFPAGLVMFITDTENTFLGASGVYVKEEGSDYALFNFGDSITLRSGTTYCAYFTASDTAASLQVGQQITKSECISQELAAVGGTYDANGASDWGLLNGLNSITTPTYAPDMTLQVKTAPIPEPTTATLSILALAGLAARRYRK